MLILDDLKDKNSYNKKRNGLIKKSSNLPDFKKLCNIISYLRISSSYPYKSIQAEDKTKKYRN